MRSTALLLGVLMGCCATPALGQSGAPPVAVGPLGPTAAGSDRYPFPGPNGQQPRFLSGVDSRCPPGASEPRWRDQRVLPFQEYGPGEYTGPARHRHVDNYRIRVSDTLDLIYRITREVTASPYELNVGDQFRLESIGDPTLNRHLTILPDGTINLPLVGSVRAARHTLPQLERTLNEAFQSVIPEASISITPISINTRLEDLRATVDSRQGVGGTTRTAIVSADGTIQLAGLGSVPAQGLTKTELQDEINARYTSIVDGIEVTVAISTFAPSAVFVLGEVATPGRYPLQGPTTVMQAIALAGGWRIGGNLRQIVIFRRTEDWRLIATRLDLRGALLGQRPTPADELWVRDADIVLVPKSPIRRLDDAVSLVFTQGMYSIVPLQGFGWQPSDL